METSSTLLNVIRKTNFKYITRDRVTFTEMFLKRRSILSKIEEKVEELITKTVNELGYEIYDVMYVKEGKDNYLRIFIDNNSGISLDDCEKVNNAITDMLDEADIIKDQYFLEISSPGVERHIRKDQQLEAHIGKDINIKLFKAIDKQKELTGTLQKFDKEQITLLIDNQEIIIERNNISSMKRAFKWE